MHYNKKDVFKAFGILEDALRDIGADIDYDCDRLDLSKFDGDMSSVNAFLHLVENKTDELEAIYEQLDNWYK